MGTVFAIGTRGPRPSPKKSIGDCARTFCCRTISGKISHGVRGLCSPRKPHIATMTMLASTKIRRKPRSISILLVHDGNVHPAGYDQQVVRFRFAETRIARFDGKEKAVIGDAAETVPVKKGMVPPRQAVHDLPGEKGRESREKHGQLEHDREKCRHGLPIERLAMHDQRIKPPGWAELDENGGQQAGNTADQHYGAEP